MTLYIKVRAKNRKAEKIMENLSRFDSTWSLADFDRHIQNMFYTVQRPTSGIRKSPGVI